MWVTEDGVRHTVALPDPTEVMTDEFRGGLDALIATRYDSLRLVLQHAESQVLETRLPDVRRSAVYVNVPPPHGLLQGRCDSLDDVVRTVEEVAPQWRLDAIMALDDYID